MRYELYYWPSIQGRGEFVRLALEDAGVDYADIAQDQEEGAAVGAIMRLLDPKKVRHPSFAPPFLKVGDRLIGQTANILLFLGEHHGLAPRAEAGRSWTNQLQLTIADLVAEAHETHHPVSASLYYAQQKAPARRRSEDFTKHRMPKFLDYFDAVLKQNRTGYLVGRTRTYADLSLFQAIAGLRYAFPKAQRRLEMKCPRVADLYTKVEQRPRIAAYLKSSRRQAFNEDDIFRHYPELQ